MGLIKTFRLNVNLDQDAGLVIVLFFISLSVRLLVGVHQYSGYQQPLLYGDFEAQRHWQEITVNLPVSNWYSNSSDNNLQYWGLDYPPLTAYHSWLCGSIAYQLNSSWVALHSSQGIETSQHKLFMRLTVIISELCIYYPAVFVYFSHLAQTKFKGILYALFFPGLVLIDHGHFQYNNVSLGLFIAAVAAVIRHNNLLASALFVFALNYKQMELYHALPFFVYLFAQCFQGSQFLFSRFIAVGLVTAGSFVLCWLPFLGNFEVIVQVLRRLFPFNRGLYEDKVANFWCSMSIFIKFKKIFSEIFLMRLCLISTFLAIFPSLLMLFKRPTPRQFLFSLIISSLSFFLFSFQVHEKSILIPAASVLLVSQEYSSQSFWFLVVSSFSMLPLLIKDSLFAPYVSCSLVFVCFYCLLVHPSIGKSPPSVFSPFTSLLKILSVSGLVLLSLAAVVMNPPKRFPDFWPVMISIFSFIHFLSFLLYFYSLQISDHGFQKKLSKPKAIRKSKKLK